MLIGLWCNDWSFRCWGCDRAEIVFGTIFFLMITAFATFIGGAIAVGLGSVLGISSMDADPEHIGKMISMRSSDSVAGEIHGGLFMISGFIGGAEYYHWYEQNGDAIEPKQVKAAGGIYIYEQDRADGQVKIYDWHNKYPSWALLIGLPDPEATGQTYEFFIPKGSIKREFKLQ